MLQATFADRGHHADHEPDTGQQPGRGHDDQQRYLGHVRQRVAEQPGRRSGPGHHAGPGRQPPRRGAQASEPPLGDRQRRLRLRGEGLLEPGLVDDHGGVGASGAREGPHLGHQPDRDAGVAHRQRQDLTEVGARGTGERPGRDHRDWQPGRPGGERQLARHRLRRHPGIWTRCPDPTVNVSAAVSPLARQEVTAGAIPWARGLARSEEEAAACHRSRASAPANGAGKPPEIRGETARPRMASVAAAAAWRCSARRAARRGRHAGVRRRREPRQLIAHRQAQQPQRVAGPARGVEDGGQLGGPVRRRAASRPGPRRRCPSRPARTG